VYHGVQSERAHFTTVLSEIHTFLSRHPSESILVSIKEEVPPIVPRFGELVWNALAPHVDRYWFLETRLPTLGEIRGRAMILPRFSTDPQSSAWDKGVGLKVDGWPDDKPEGFEVGCGEDSVNVQDWYGVPSVLKIPDKLEAVRTVRQRYAGWR
jgi:1-phosphatidylinositol phosphodiesterase